MKHHQTLVFTTAVVIIFWAFLILYQIFVSRQGERDMTNIHKNCICKMPNDLPNNLILRILGNLEVWKFQENLKTVWKYYKKLLLKSRSWTCAFYMKSKVCLKYFLFMIVVYSFPGNQFMLLDFSNILWEEKSYHIHVLPCQDKKELELWFPSA